MLFILDQDVSAEVGRVIRQAGHKCHTVGSAGLYDASDDEVSTFAADHDAIFLTHDKEMTHRRRRNTFGRHVLLACNEWEAPAVVEASLDQIIATTQQRDDICIKLTKDNLTAYPNRWE